MEQFGIAIKHEFMNRDGAKLGAPLYFHLVLGPQHHFYIPT